MGRGRAIDVGKSDLIALLRPKRPRGHRAENDHSDQHEQAGRYWSQRCGSANAGKGEEGKGGRGEETRGGMRNASLPLFPFSPLPLFTFSGDFHQTVTSCSSSTLKRSLTWLRTR